MRHRKDNHKLSRTSAHQRALFANMLKSLIVHERIETTVPKAKYLKRYADKIITLAKSNSLASRRKAVSELMVSYNRLDPKEARKAKEGKREGYNEDRQVIEKLFGTLGPRFATRPGGYTRIIKGNCRMGDRAEMCLIEYLSE